MRRRRSLHGRQETIRSGVPPRSISESLRACSRKPVAAQPPHVRSTASGAPTRWKPPGDLGGDLRGPRRTAGPVPSRSRVGMATRTRLIPPDVREIYGPDLHVPSSVWSGHVLVDRPGQVVALDTTAPNSCGNSRHCPPVFNRQVTPSNCCRSRSGYTVSHDPYRSGMSRHGMPVRVRSRIPLNSCRFVCTGHRPGLMPFGNSGSSTADCASVRSPRAMRGGHDTTLIHF